MKLTTGILIAVALLFVALPYAHSAGLTTSLKCFHEEQYRFFDLKPLMKDR